MEKDWLTLPRLMFVALSVMGQVNLVAQHTDRGMGQGLKIRILTKYNPVTRKTAVEMKRDAPFNVTAPTDYTSLPYKTMSHKKLVWKRSLMKDKENTETLSATTEPTNYKVILEYEYEYEEDSSTDLSYLLAPSPSSPGPYIDTYHSSNVSALAGVTTFLNCRVHKLGNKTVSWIRQENLHLLTVGRYTYTSDLRFEASHTPHSVDWTLTIRDPQPFDSGMYQCQVSTTPHMSTNIWLDVKDPATIILGAPSIYVQVGSTINLTCIILNTEKPPENVTWLKDSEEISYSGPRPGVSMITDKSVKTVVTLILALATLNDSGTYSCCPNYFLADLPMTNITVNVLDGDKTAQLSRQSRTLFSDLKLFLLLLVMSLKADIL